MKIGIVGTGKVAQGNYLPFLAKQKDVELIYYSRTADKARACAEKFGGRAAATPAELTAAGCDAILVLTREMDRYDATMALLDGRPRRLFFEKPLVAMAGQANVSEDDFLRGKALLKRAGEVGCQTAMVFNYRFFDQTQRARRLAAERGFGALIQVAGLVNYATWSHCIDLALWFGGGVRSVAGLAGPTVRKGAGNEAVDVTASFVFESGAVGSLIGTAGTKTLFPFFELVLSFEGGRIWWRDLDGDMELLDHAVGVHETYSLPRQTSRWDQYGASFDKSLAAYLVSVRSDAPPPIPGEAGLRELQFEAALRRAIREGRPVDVAAEFPLA